MQNKTKILKNIQWRPLFGVLKWLVPFLIALILYKKFFRNNALSVEAFGWHLMALEWQWFLLLPAFSFLNWFTEIGKWKFLVSRLEPHSFRKAAKGVLSGMAVSQLLPYRTGEYLGRLAYVEDKNKIRAGILSVAGSFSQLLVTLLAGLAAFLYIRPFDFPLSFFISFTALLLLLVLGYFYMPQFSGIRKNAWMETIRSALQLLSKRDLMKLLALSSVRYLSFLIPYAMLAARYQLGGHEALQWHMTAVACVYFLQTVSPNFILTDLAIRISVSAIVFSGAADNVNGIDHIPGMLIYLFNVALPMCAGAIVLLFLRLRK